MVKNFVLQGIMPELELRYRVMHWILYLITKRWNDLVGMFRGGKYRKHGFL